MPSRAVQQRKLNTAREMASRTLSQEVNHREQHLKLVRMTQVKLAKAIVDGDIKMSLRDLDKLIRLESFLRDGADSRQEIVVADLRNKSTEELREMIRDEIVLLQKVGSGLPSVERDLDQRGMLLSGDA